VIQIVLLGPELWVLRADRIAHRGTSAVVIRRELPK
jgi:hypothetical protein